MALESSVIREESKSFLLIASFISDVSTLVKEQDLNNLNRRLDLLLPPLSVELKIKRIDRPMYGILFIDEFSRQNYEYFDERHLWSKFFQLKMQYLQDVVLVNEDSFSVMIREFLTQVIDVVASDDGVVNRVLPRNVQIARDLIKERIHDAPTVQSIAGSLGVSERLLSRQFKQFLNISLNSYILQARVNESKSLLKYSNLSMRQIAEMAGFKDQSNYSRKFREIVGVSPSDYRKKEFALNDSYLFDLSETDFED